MKKESTQENFERFLKDNADELRMRPAAGVWNRIEARLNRRRRWVFFTSGFFLITASLFGYLIIDQSKHPSDPFADVHTLQQKANISTSSTEGISNGIAASPTVVQTKQRASNTALKTGSKTQLFQKPMLPTTTDHVNTAAEGTLAFTPIPFDESQPFDNKATTSAAKPFKTHAELPLSIESVVNTYQPIFKRRKTEFQFFFTPTVSYRRLTENKSYLRAVPRNAAPYNYAALYDVNNVVTHKPDLGLEMGFAFKYALNSRLKLRSGLQFNITRYSIKAFTYTPEFATISLNTRSGGIESLNTISSYRNYNDFSSGTPDWLQNFYFQVSAPVGAEFTTSTAKKTRFGIAASVQPTYILGDRAYLISTDYKNYSQVPWLIRRWNANTSLETFVSYSSGKLRWQVGPQVRYQLLSSFVQQYPVKENLFDFGMKIGVSLDKK